MSPEERASRLFDRVMRYGEEGKADSVQFFAPDGHPGVRHARSDGCARALRRRHDRRRERRCPLARAEADTILAQQQDPPARSRPRHEGRAACDRTRRPAPSYRRRLVAAAPAERAKKLTEYEDHKADIDAALKAPDECQAVTRVIHVAHSPDSDDAFMFYALAEGQDRDRRPHVRARAAGHRDAQPARASRASSKSRRSRSTRTRSSPIATRCSRSGASMGDRYGPRLVSRAPAARAEQSAASAIAIPGPLTSAYLALRLYEPDFDPVFIALRPDRGCGRRAASVDFGLLIHEGQLTFGDRGLHLVADMGEWWFEETGLPLPLGGNVIRKDLGNDLNADDFTTSSRQHRVWIATSVVTPSITRCSSPGDSIARRPMTFVGHVRERLDTRLRRSRPPRDPRTARTRRRCRRHSA